MRLAAAYLEGVGEDTWKVAAIDRPSTSSVSTGYITSLTHESGYDAMKFGIFVSKTLLSRTQSTKILGCFYATGRTIQDRKKETRTGNNVVVQLDDNATCTLTAYAHVEL